MLREIEAKSILRRQKGVDSWFVAPYGMNLYRGCTHACAYCDGRAERYYVEGDFGRDLTVKVNALEVLRRELDPRRRRKPLARGYVFLGGGVGDSYQPAEASYRLARGALELLLDRRLPVHLLTKSTLARRDAQLLREVHAAAGAIFSISLSTVDEAVSSIFEPGVPSPAARLETLAFFKSLGVPCGVYLLPVLPGLSDDPGRLEATLAAAAEAGADFLCFGGLTLRPGRQEQHYLRTLERFQPALLPSTRRLYPGSPWGAPTQAYARELAQRVWPLARRHRLPLRLPPRLYWHLLGDNDRLVVALEHIDYLLRLRGRPSRFAAAARSLRGLQAPLTGGAAARLPGVAAPAAAVIEELLARGRSALYESLLYPEERR